MAGLVHLPRMIDKCRAYKENKLADYIFPCPLDKIILTFLRVDAEVFANMTNDKQDDEINEWAKEIIKSKFLLYIEYKFRNLGYSQNSEFALW